MAERVSSEEIDLEIREPWNKRSERFALDLRDARRELDEAKAEIERLKLDLKAVTWTPDEKDAEIERLTAQRDAAAELAAGAINEIERLKAEVERWREVADTNDPDDLIAHFAEYDQVHRLIGEKLPTDRDEFGRFNAMASIDEAADEIARLKFDLRAVTWTPDEKDAEIERLTAQRDALAGALRRMDWLFASDPPCAKPTAPTKHYESGLVLVMQAREQARAALAAVEET